MCIKKVLAARGEYAITGNTKKFTRQAVLALLPDGKLPEGKMLETYYTDKLRLVDADKALHNPGFDARFDEEVDLPKGLNLHEFLATVDEMLGIKYWRYEAYTSGYLWRK